MAKEMRAGFGKAEIRFPEEMLPVEGFCKIHDNPHVRIMYLENNREAMALCVMELVNVPEKEITYARKQMAQCFKIPLQKTWVHMTHVITTPHEPGPMGPPDKRPPVTERQMAQREMFSAAVRSACMQALQETVRNISPAKLGWGKGSCQANQNRDVKTPYGWWIGTDGEGPTDKEMDVLQLEDADGNRKGIFVNYGLKPCVIDNSGMEDGSRQISSDCCGRACSMVEEKTGAVVIYTMGAAADQVPVKVTLTEQVCEDGQICVRDEGVETGLSYMEEIAEILAESILFVADQTECTEKNPVMEWAAIRFEWELRKGEPRKLMLQPENRPEGRTGTYTAEALRIGNGVILANRTETTAQTGLELREKSPFFYTALMCMTNGEAKYMPDARSVERGTWEAQSARYMPGCAEKFVQEAAAAMERLMDGNVKGQED